jgi:hypothetical protein
MKITKKLLEKMVREELNNLDEGGEEGLSFTADWSLPRQLASLLRLVSSNPGPNAGEHRAAMDIINSMIAKHGTDDGSAGLVDKMQAARDEWSASKEASIAPE